MAQSAGLAGNAAAGDGSNDIHLAGGAGGFQGLADDHLQGLQTEILVDVTAVDGDGTVAALEQVDAGNRGLSSAGAVHIRLLARIHSRLPPN